MRWQVFSSSFRKNSCDEAMANLGLFITPQERRRELFMKFMLILISQAPSPIRRQWGRALALLESFRTIFEPFNHSRRIIGFDTFAGYEGLSKKDGQSKQMADGNHLLATGTRNFLKMFF